jgi:hypothetical protein
MKNGVFWDVMPWGSSRHNIPEDAILQSDGIVPSFMTLALEEGEWTASRSYRCTLAESLAVWIGKEAG